MFEYYLQKFHVKDFFFARYFDIEKQRYVNSFILKENKANYADLWNKKDLKLVDFDYVKPFTEYAKLDALPLTAYKAQKLAKQFKEKFEDYVDYQEDLFNDDPNRLKTHVLHDTFNAEDAIVLSEDQYSELN